MGVERSPPVSAHEAPDLVFEYASSAAERALESELQVVPALGENQAALNVLDNGNERVERVVFFLEGPDRHSQETDG